MGAATSGVMGFVFGAVAATGGLFWAVHHGPLRASFEKHVLAETGAKPAPSPAATAEKPAYLVVLGEVYDREKFMAEYTAKLPPIYKKFGGEYLAVGRNFEILEGEGDFKSFIVSKWPSMAAVKSFWTSPEYDALRRARIEGNWGLFDVYALEGLAEPRTSAAAPPQPK